MKLSPVELLFLSQFMQLLQASARKQRPKEYYFKRTDPYAEHFYDSRLYLHVAGDQILIVLARRGREPALEAIALLAKWLYIPADAGPATDDQLGSVRAKYGPAWSLASWAFAKAQHTRPSRLPSLQSGVLPDRSPLWRE
jgi:hypothetical protein